MRHRGAVIRIDDRAGGTRPVVQAPYRFSNGQAGVRGVAPHRGEHNAAVLKDWLRCGDAEVAKLMAAGVLLRAGETTEEPTPRGG